MGFVRTRVLLLSATVLPVVAVVFLVASLLGGPFPGSLGVAYATVPTATPVASGLSVRLEPAALQTLADDVSQQLLAPASFDATLRAGNPLVTGSMFQTTYAATASNWKHGAGGVSVAVTGNVPATIVARGHLEEVTADFEVITTGLIGLHLEGTVRLARVDFTATAVMEPSRTGDVVAVRILATDATPSTVEMTLPGASPELRHPMVDGFVPVFKKTMLDRFNSVLVATVTDFANALPSTLNLSLIHI